MKLILISQILFLQTYIIIIRQPIYLFFTKMKTNEYFAIFFCTGLIIGYMYNLDAPQALETQLRQDPYNFTTVQYNLMYVLPFFIICLTDIPMGALIDHFSTKILVPVTLGLSSMSLVFLAVVLQNLPEGYLTLTLVCRSIFGMAGELAYSIQGVILAKLSKNNYEFLTSLCWSFGYLIDSTSSLITTQLYESSKKVSTPLYVGSIISLFSLIIGILLVIYMDKMKDQSSEQQKLLCKVQAQSNQDQIKQINSPEQQQQENSIEQNKSVLESIKSYRKEFWILVFITFFSQCSMCAFNDNLNDMLNKRFGFSYADAGKLLMIPFGAMTIYSMIIGKVLALLPHLRRKILVLTFAFNFLMIIAFYYLPNSTQPTSYHYFFIILFLLSESVGLGTYYSGVMPLVVLVVPEATLGLGWGIIGTAIAFSGAFGPIIYGLIVSINEDNLSEGYRDLTLCGVVFSCLALITVEYLYFGQFGIFNKKYSDIESQRIERGVPLEELIEKYKNLV